MFLARAALSGLLPQEWTRQVLDDSDGPSSPLTGSSSHPSSPSLSPSREAYDPDLDDYDVRTAPVLPPAPGQLEDEWKQRQIRALEGRIAKGGDEAVLNHYRKVVSELSAPCIQKRKLCHMRNSSTSSTCTTSTVFPEDAADLESADSDEAAWGPVPWLYAAEIFSNSERDAANGLAVGVEYAGNVAMIYITPFFIDLGMVPSMAFFTVVNFLIAAFCFRYVTETRGVPVELVPALFGGAARDKFESAHVPA